MVIKLIVSDFDGVLINLPEAHYLSLNQAIEEIAGKEYIITRQEHVSFYNGLSTKTKLNKLVQEKSLPVALINKINELKQKYTIQAIEENFSENLTLKEDLSKLKSEGYLLYCASNAIQQTVETGLKKIGIFELFDHILSNEDVKKQKPAPDIYLQCFLHAGVDPKETLIIEDSKHGRESATRSGAYVCDVDNETETTYLTIKNSIERANKENYKPKFPNRNRLNVLIPMSGAGSRFKEANYTLPKPLIDVNGKPMIQVVVENLNIDANYIFIVQKEHYQQYNLEILLNLITPGCKIIIADGLTEGAACSALLAKEFINNNNHLLMANSDQWIGWNSADFLDKMTSSNVDGGIQTFHREDDPKWSYAQVDEKGYVLAVAEKQVISNHATTGIYYWSKGSDFVKYAEEMIKLGLRVGNEFYSAPVYNRAIKDGKKIITYNCEKMFGLGTPHDLEYFLNNCPI